MQHDTAALVWNDEEGNYVADELVAERAALAVQLYRLMPGYAHFIYAGPFMLSDSLIDCTVATLRFLLEEPAEPLADPVAYWLHVDAFEFDPDTWWPAMIAAADVPAASPTRCCCRRALSATNHASGRGS